MSARELGDDFAGSFETAFAGLQIALLEACGQEDAWPAKVAAGVRAGLRLAAAEPAAAQALTNDALAGGTDGIARHERLLEYLGEQLQRGREEGPGGEHLPDSTERAVAGGVVMLVAQRLDQGKAKELPALAPEAIQFVLTPYLGAAEARRVGFGDRGGFRD
jgi:hypothetical protein